MEEIFNEEEPLLRIENSFPKEDNMENIHHMDDENTIENIDKSLDCCMALLSGTILQILKLRSIRNKKMGDMLFVKERQPPEEFLCPICLGENTDEDITSIECGHSYHISCIREWNRVRNTCPMCIKILTPKSMKISLV